MGLVFGGAEQLWPLWGALSRGACFSGNGSLIGASANLIVAGASERAGHHISFVKFTLIAFPLAYFIFAVPIGEFLIPLLQHFTAAFVVKALQATGVPVLWEGLFFYLPDGAFEVAKAWGGVRYIIPSLTFGTLYGYLIYIFFLILQLYIFYSLLYNTVYNNNLYYLNN